MTSYPADPKLLACSLKAPIKRCPLIAKQCLHGNRFAVCTPRACMRTAQHTIECGFPRALHRRACTAQCMHRVSSQSADGACSPSSAWQQVPRFRCTTSQSTIICMTAHSCRHGVNFCSCSATPLLRHSTWQPAHVAVQAYAVCSCR